MSSLQREAETVKLWPLPQMLPTRIVCLLVHRENGVNPSIVPRNKHLFLHQWPMISGLHPLLAMRPTATTGSLQSG